MGRDGTLAIDCGCETAVYSLTIAVGDTLYRRDEHPIDVRGVYVTE
ncbi:hypothetical protein [Halomontanus rarus]